MDAALAEYAEHGSAGFSLNAVARRAGVGKSAVYLRWSGKDDLLAEAVESRAHAVEEVDTGSLRGDLEALAANLVRLWRDPAGWVTLRVAVDALGAGTPPGTFHARVTRSHREAATAVLRRAVERGEAADTLPVTLLVQSLYGTLLMQVLGGVGSDDDPAPSTTAVVDLLLAAVAEHLR
jgi:AcrR family transcriptional regulator